MSQSYGGVVLPSQNRYLFAQFYNEDPGAVWNYYREVLSEYWKGPALISLGRTANNRNRACREYDDSRRDSFATRGIDRTISASLVFVYYLFATILFVLVPARAQISMIRSRCAFFLRFSFLILLRSFDNFRGAENWRREREVERARDSRPR